MDVLELVSGEAPVVDARGFSLSPADAASVLGGAGWLALRLDCSGMAGKEGLFASFASALGREYFASNWDAFDDALSSLPYDAPASAGYAFLMENYAALPSGEAVMFEEAVRDSAAGVLTAHNRRLRALLF